jgi:hypothetical protein
MSTDEIQLALHIYKDNGISKSLKDSFTVKSSLAVNLLTKVEDFHELLETLMRNHKSSEVKALFEE